MTIASLGPNLSTLASFAGFATWFCGFLAAFFPLTAKDRVCSFFLFAGALFLGIGATAGFNGNHFETQAVIFGFTPLSLSYDPLSSFFILLLCLVVSCVALYCPGYLAHLPDQGKKAVYWICLFAFIAAMALVILSATAPVFLVFWEVMALSSALLVALDYLKHRSQNAALIYLAATRISSALLCGAFILQYVRTHSWNFSDWSFGSQSALVPALLVFLGLAIKSGLWPFHLWLPYAHAEAPAPVSALMSGVMVKVAIYAMIRFLVQAQCLEISIAILLIVLGAISSLWGVLFALIQNDVKKLLAYSTIENIGLICLSLGLCLFCRIEKMMDLALLALVASMFHCFNHATFKSLLFFGAGAIDSSVHTRELTYLGGLARRMPYTMVSFLVGGAAACALPPLNGFASKYLIYQDLFRLSFCCNSQMNCFVGLFFIALLSLVGALSLALFAKAIGISFLGRPRSEAASQAVEVSWGMKAAQAVLAFSCFGIGVMAAPLIRFLQLKFGTYLGPLSTRIGFDVSSAMFSLPVIAISGISLFLLIFQLCLHRKKGGQGEFGLKRYITWDCGYGALGSRAEETASSFSAPITRLFAPLYYYKVTTEIHGKDRRHFPESIKAEVLVISFLETHIYRPVIQFLQMVSHLLVRLQTGSIHVHLLYIFVTLLLLLLIGVRL